MNGFQILIRPASCRVGTGSARSAATPVEKENQASMLVPSFVRLEGEVMDNIGRAALEGIALIEETPITGRERGINRFRTIAEKAFDPLHEAKVESKINDCVSVLRQAAARGTLTDELIDAETGKLATAIKFGGFESAPVRIDEVSRLGKALESVFSGAEIDIVRMLCARGAKIEAFDAENIVIGGRRFSRFELREAGRPQSWTNRESWHGQFPPLKG
jgi:hypothetical protein